VARGETAEIPAVAVAARSSVTGNIARPIRIDARLEVE